MRTDVEFLSTIHRRAGRIREQKIKKSIALLSGACAALLILLVGFTVTPHTIGSGGLTGTSIVDSAVGGYVLVAVIAFMAGTVITVLIKRHLAKNGSVKDDGWK